MPIAERHNFWVLLSNMFMAVQYIPRNMHTVFALLCFVVVIQWLIFPYPSGLLHWHGGNLTIAPMPAKQPWWIWINTSCEFIMNDCITTTKLSTTKPCAYFLGCTVYCHFKCMWYQLPILSISSVLNCLKPHETLGMNHSKTRFSIPTISASSTRVHIIYTFEYRNWYQYWGRCCLINDLRSSQQPEGEAYHVFMGHEWPKLRHQSLFYYDETKSVMNKHIMSIQMFKIVLNSLLVTAWLHVHILGSSDLIVSPW